MITIAALGVREDDITLGAIAALKSGRKIILRTCRMGAAQWLSDNAIAFSTLDEVYDTSDELEDVAQRCAEEILNIGDVVYGVMDLRDETAGRLLARGRAELIPGVGLDAALTAFADGATVSFAAIDASEVRLSAGMGALAREIDSRELAGDVKIRLMDVYPENSKTLFLKPDGAIAPIALSELDRMSAYDHRAAAYVFPERDITRLERYDADGLLKIVARLCAPDGCPWDRVQTHETLKSDMLEEAYEVIDAIESGNTDRLYDELGDVLLQVALHSEIGRRHSQFDISDVTTAICKKLIFRHPHVFQTASAENPDEVRVLWEAQKMKENSFASRADAMRGITRALPATLRAYKVQKKARDAGFDWNDAREAIPKIHEEADELLEAIGTLREAEEAGDLLFSVINALRLLKIDPELALKGATEKFIARFDAIERMIASDGRDMSGMTLAEMDEYWDRAKKNM